ncbi:lytic transglycosylase domain-containing protein [Jannaschia seohaensis]|uniref:Transglycosylase SLT domain-containing protein n=1 Tax=Jannaschia seohaensis TaxID=475081 RepID=A0A2Y9BXU2_9RHOB|nr:lytic transglycosylase domain-containing protein [Jannaschia seohaensis]PWJ21022.1 transglycosylase-like protein with SLT domain [Jannaschia seohaensis]SSA41432.1 Transglycosylase SLT domain-containing protein [Jannaschia seohaensis]
MWRLALLLACLAGLARAEGPPAELCSKGIDAPERCIRMDPAHFATDLCAQIEADARHHGLPPGFLARLLWQESRFDPNVVSPMRARGIAQFIDSTARLRELEDPFNPAEAVARSAEYLGEMTRRYGSLGLAAIGYNGGERRAEGWKAGTGGLARETRAYVSIITGHSAEAWRDEPPDEVSYALDGDTPFQEACVTMAAKRRVTPLGPPPSRVSAWGAQIAFGTSRSAARAAWGRLPASCRRAAPEDRLDYVPVRRRGPGDRVYMMVRVGADSRVEATGLCRTISRAGCPCRAFRN